MTATPPSLSMTVAASPLDSKSLAAVLSLIKSLKRNMKKAYYKAVQSVKRNTPRHHLFFGAGPPTERPLVFFAAASSSFSF